MPPSCSGKASVRSRASLSRARATWAAMRARAWPARCPTICCCCYSRRRATSHGRTAPDGCTSRSLTQHAHNHHGHTAHSPCACYLCLYDFGSTTKLLAYQGALGGGDGQVWQACGRRGRLPRRARALAALEPRGQPAQDTAPRRAEAHVRARPDRSPDANPSPNPSPSPIHPIPEPNPNQVRARPACGPRHPGGGGHGDC